MTPGSGIFRTKLPLGFTAGGVNCGVRNYRPDLGMIVSESDCVASAVFTQNACKGAPISYCQPLVPATHIKAIVTNSGQANAMTGEQGVLNNQAMVDAAAQAIGCESTQVLSASTGVIGQQLEIDKIVAGMPILANSLSNIAEKFAVAVMTTDLVPKTANKELFLSTGKVTITGICKGSGMIHPNMATMLGYILTDAQLTVAQSECMLKKACDQSFNMISVDGDTSTNDTVFMLANGQSGIALETAEDEQLFYTAIEELMIVLAKSIARDGEGASKLLQVTVKGLDDEVLAKTIARSLTVSPLIKTAIYGESPNWGRILSRIGSEAIDPALIPLCQIWVQDVLVYAAKGVGDLSSLAKKMQEDTVTITVDFQSGQQQAVAWGCDLTEKYVKINAEYLS